MKSLYRAFEFNIPYKYSYSNVSVFLPSDSFEYPLPVIIMPSGEWEELPKEITDISLPYCLVNLSVPDWNRDLSPWKSGISEEFTGEGKDFLNLILDRVLPEAVRMSCADIGRTGIIGYSLAGLFSLWAIYVSDIFSAAASCSGSLWYDDFTDFMRRTEPARSTAVYLSLGGKEEKSRNPLFSTIGNKTREARDILKSSGNVSDAVLVMNPGGHGKDVGKRLANGIDYLLKHI